MKLLEEMSLEELWILFPILLKPYNPDYPHWYAEKRGRLLFLLKDYPIYRIHHIGSTAVEGLISKPIIDILLELDASYTPDTIIDILKEDNWLLMAQNNAEHTLDFNKGYTPQGFQEKTYHLHIKPKGDWDELYFRDYLKTHPDASRNYEKLKLELKEQYEHHRDAYTEAKTEFVVEYTKKARQEFPHRYALLPSKENLTSIHKMQDYLENHLEDSLTLKELAESGGYSPFHFQKLHTATTGESPKEYSSRVRLERAAYLLLYLSENTITEVAHFFGYSDSAVFSRAFKQHFGVTPTEYRKNCKANPSSFDYTFRMDPLKGGNQMNQLQLTTEMIDWEVLYLRHTGSYETLGNAFPTMAQQLFAFSMRESLLIPESTKLLAIYHDNPQITDSKNLRTSVGLTVPKGTVPPADSDFGILPIVGRYTIGHFELLPTEISQAWEVMYQWLMKGDYQPRDSFPFEVYTSEPERATGKQKIDIYLAIE